MRKGQTMSDEQKIKISNAHKGMKKPWSGKYMTVQHKADISERMMGNTLCLGRVYTPETLEKIKQSNIGKKHVISKAGLKRMKIKNYDVWNKGSDKRISYTCLICNKEFKSYSKSKYCSQTCSHLDNKSQNHYRWIKDRSKVKLDKERGGTLHKEWSKSIKSRDGWKCRISNGQCVGKIQAHHILSWSKYPDLRYDLSNGISLCKEHHPRKRQDEIKMIPIFRKLIRGLDSGY